MLNSGKLQQSSFALNRVIPFVFVSENEGYPHLYFCVLVSKSLRYFFLIFLGFADMLNGDEFVNGAQHSRGTSFPRCLMPWERPGPWLALGSQCFFAMVTVPFGN